jgi:hypothetical protein
VSSEQVFRAGTIELSRIVRDWSSGSPGSVTARSPIPASVWVEDGNVHIGIGSEEVSLDAVLREQFAEIYVRASHEADAAGAP